MKTKKDFLDYLLVLLNYKKLLIYSFFIIVVTAVIISLLLPQWYRSGAKVLFPMDKGSAGLNMSAIIGDLPIDLGQSGSLEFNRLKTIFSSRSFQDDVILKFELQSTYDKDYLFETREELQEHYSVNLDFEDNSVNISFEYKKSKEKAKEICDYMLTKADSIYKEMRGIEAKNNRIYIESLYNDAIEKLYFFEDSLKKFQEKNRTYHLDTQLEATITNLAIMEQKLTEITLEYEYLDKIMDKSSSKIRDLLLQKNALEKKLKYANEHAENYSVLLPINTVAGIGLEYYKLKREIEILTKVLEFLTPQYESALIDENQKKPSFLILDHPNLPEYKNRPKRAFVVLGITLLAMLLIISYVFVITALRDIKVNDPQKHEKIKKLSGFIKQ